MAAHSRRVWTEAYYNLNDSLTLKKLCIYFFFQGFFCYFFLLPCLLCPSENSSIGKLSNSIYIFGKIFSSKSLSSNSMIDWLIWFDFEISLQNLNFKILLFLYRLNLGNKAIFTFFTLFTGKEMLSEIIFTQNFEEQNFIYPVYVSDRVCISTMLHI